MVTKPHNAEFFDGKSAMARLVHARVMGDTLVISQTGATDVQWPLNNVELVSGGKPGQALRLKLHGDHGSRLTLPEGSAADAVIAAAPAILTGHKRRFWKGVGISVAVVLALGVAGYATLAVAPQALARFIPDEVVNSFADGLEKSVIKSSKRCDAPAGRDALNKIARRIVSGTEDPPTFSLRVFDIRQAGNKKLINAFALPGGRMVFSAGLIENADSADEVAGVLAHELGHVALRHPEAAIVRVYGVQMLLSLFTAGQGADSLGSIAGVIAVLRYSREAEAQADAYAVEVMENANVDPKGLRNFFARLIKKNTSTGGEAKADDSTSFRKRIEPLTDLFSTHPGTDDRIARLVPRPGGTEPAILSDAEWRALKAICK
ncbi:MAG: M48 family metallopeptidase [Pseudomonadota bacterium]